MTEKVTKLFSTEFNRLLEEDNELLSQLQTIYISTQSQLQNLVKEDYPRKIAMGEVIVNVNDLELLKKCNQLQELIIWGQSLSTINLEPIRDCKNLRRLDLVANRLETINLSPLESFHSLQVLSLKHNKLKEINFYPLRYCNELLHIILSNNELKCIELSYLRTSLKLLELCLDNNNIDEINVSPIIRLSELFFFRYDGDRTRLLCEAILIPSIQVPSLLIIMDKIEPVYSRLYF